MALLSFVESAPRAYRLKASNAAPASSTSTGTISKIETKEIDICVGGLWRFDMIAPDGQRFTNRMIFRRIERPTLIEFDHGTDSDDDPGRFRTTITFDEQGDSKTVITLRQLHPTKAKRDAGIGFGAVEYGYQTLEKLARHVEALRA